MLSSDATIRKLTLSTFQDSARRPCFYFANTTWAEASLVTLLQLLACNDGIAKRLAIAYLSQRGERDTIEQHILGQHLIARPIIGEVVSSLAEVGCLLGYLSVSVEYKVAAIKKLTNRSFFAKDWTDTDLVNLLGPPTFDVNAGAISTYCYGATGEPWYYFDFLRLDSTNMKLRDQPALRNVRFPGNKVRMIDKYI